MLDGVAKRNETKQTMTYIVYSDETKELIEDLIKQHDPDAFTDNSAIKSYEIDSKTISANPIGGIMFIILGSNEDGKSVIESYTLHPKLADIWRISQYE